MRLASRLAVLLALLLGMAGCYETDQEIFEAGSAVAIPGLEGRYVNGDTVYIVSRIEGSKDYRYVESAPSPAGEGTLRIVPAGGDVFLVQLHRKEWEPNVHLQLIFRILRSGDAIRELQQLSVGDKLLTTQAEKTGVSLPKEGEQSGSKTGGGGAIKGSREAIAAFLRGLAAGPFDHADIYTRTD
jgi:hypothetical protein